MALLATLGALGLTLPTGAQDRRASLRLLRESGDFRVRVQAAFSLGSGGDRRARRPLERALRDPNAAVRAAAATALGRLGDPQARAALARAREDSAASVRMQVERALRSLEEAAAPTEPQVAPRPERSGQGFYPAVSVIPRADRVPWPRVRHVVVLGDMTDSSRFEPEPRAGPPPTSLSGQLAAEVRRHLRLVRGIAIFDSPEELGDEARAQIRRRRIPSLRLQGNIVNLERSVRRREFSVRCEISLMLLGEPDRNLRGMLTGAATGTEPPRADRAAQEARLAEQALSAAVRSAMSDAQRAIREAARAQAGPGGS
ncbi:MAG: HEAT repeat domain-containing protein, partial [Myxococcales bacterium]|nr:HEAT repeat domain-containing protein [Myxococcales bacterium]